MEGVDEEKSWIEITQRQKGNWREESRITSFSAVYKLSMSCPADKTHAHTLMLAMETSWL